jgi:hypothetical protein
MPRAVRDWEVDEHGVYHRFLDPYPAQREAEGELTAAQANIIMLTPYFKRYHLMHRRHPGSCERAIAAIFYTEG